MRGERNGQRIVVFDEQNTEIPFLVRMRGERNGKRVVVFGEQHTEIPFVPQSLGKRREHDEKRTANELSSLC
jgi:hypothetical protein